MRGALTRVGVESGKLAWWPATGIYIHHKMVTCIVLRRLIGMIRIDYPHEESHDFYNYTLVQPPLFVSAKRDISLAFLATNLYFLFLMD
jgi:hypothetical protein